VRSLFIRLINDQQNKELEAKVSKEELKLLHYFKKARSLELHGWTTKFYLGLYDFLEDDLLTVI